MTNSMPSPAIVAMKVQGGVIRRGSLRQRQRCRADAGEQQGGRRRVDPFMSRDLEEVVGSDRLDTAPRRLDAKRRKPAPGLTRRSRSA